MNRTVARIAARASTVGTAIAAVVAANAGNVAAAESVTLQAIADVDVSVSWSATSATVCASGVVNDGTPIAGVWTFVVAGGGAAGPIVAAPRTPTLGLSLPSTCATARTGVAGGFVATVTFTGVTVGGGDVVGICAVVGARTTTGTEVGTCTDPA